MPNLEDERRTHGAHACWLPARTEQAPGPCPRLAAGTSRAGAASARVAPAASSGAGRSQVRVWVVRAAAAARSWEENELGF